MSWSPTLFSGSGPIGLPPVPWTEKTIERSPLFIRRGGHCCHEDLVGRTTFWIFLNGLQKLEQRVKKCSELREEYVEKIQSLVTVASFLPGRAKDLSAPPHTSKHLQAWGTSDRNVWHILHSNLNLHMQTVHSLSDRDKEVCLQFCHFQGMLPENLDLLNILMSNEAHMHWQRTVNKQNFRYWLAANDNKVPFMIQNYCLVCCLVQRRHWPYFLQNKDGQAITVTRHFAEIINEFLASKLPPDHTLWFQQDGNTAHMAVISKAALRHLFPQQVISCVGDVPGPPHSLDLTALD